MENPNRRKLARFITTGIPVFLLLLIGYKSICGLNKVCSLNGIKWMWHMMNKDYYGLIGQHLDPGREYYFEVKPAVFITSYPQHPPVTAETIEPQEVVVITTVYPDQKSYQDTVYRRERIPSDKPVDLSQFSITENGDYFFSTGHDGAIGTKISIDQALREPQYFKVSSSLQKPEKTALVTRISESHITYTYWPSTGNRMENHGFEIENGKREEWHVCYAESDGSRMPCHEQPRKP